jgi:hypothetical protein
MGRRDAVHFLIRADGVAPVPVADVRQQARNNRPKTWGRPSVVPY